MRGLGGGGGSHPMSTAVHMNLNKLSGSSSKYLTYDSNADEENDVDEESTVT